MRRSFIGNLRRVRGHVRGRVHGWARALALTIGPVLLVCGCAGPFAAQRQPKDPVPLAALLSSRDVPSSLMPGADPQVFEGVEPYDRDCERLLELADGDGLDHRSQAYAVFHRLDPASSYAERLVRMPAAEVGERIADARAVAGRCRVMEMGGDARFGAPRKVKETRLHRERLTVDGMPDGAFGVRYVGEVNGGEWARFDIVMTSVRSGLLVVAGATVADQRKEGDLTALIADRAVRKVRSAGL